MKQFLIGAATSNSGKTTLSMGLIRALTNRGLRVQPFKCGADYIDTMFHRQASGHDSINLDTFMSTSQHVQEIYKTYSSQSDVSIIEGAMGLFDGYDRMRGSAAEIALLLNIPVILVVDARSAAYSVAALLHGFRTFNPHLRLAGAIFNCVASPSHYHFLTEACSDAGVECLGYLPRNESITVPNRHLGLTITEREQMESLIALIANEIEQHVELDKILEL